MAETESLTKISIYILLAKLNVKIIRKYPKPSFSIIQ